MTRAETKNIKEKMEYTVDPSFEGLRSTCKIVHFISSSFRTQIQNPITDDLDIFFESI